MDGLREYEILPGSKLPGDGKESRAHLRGEKSRIIPYTPLTHGPEFLKLLHAFVVRDEALDTVFGVGSFANWLDFFHFFDPAAHPDRVLISVVDKDAKEYLGFYWFDVAEGVAWGNFMFRKSMWTHEGVIEGSILALEFLFSLGIRIIVGVMSEKNRMAINFTKKRLGFTEDCTIPKLRGEDVGGVVVHLTEENLNGRS